MKKLLAILVIVGLVAGLLSGCLPEPPKPAPNTSTPAPDTSSPADSTATAAPAGDTVASASPKESADPKALLEGLSDKGFWIFSLLADVTLTETLNVDGVFYNRDNTEGKIFRKLALNTQDASYTVIDRFTLTVPEMRVTSPNFLIQNGTIKGDVYVNADGFNLTGVDIEGTLTFETQAQHDSADLSKAGTISGGVHVGNAGAPVEPDPAAEPEPEPEPDPVTEPEPEPEPTSNTATATPKPTATPKSEESTPAPTPEPTPTPTPAPTPEPAPDAGSDATAEATG